MVEDDVDDDVDDDSDDVWRRSYIGNIYISRFFVDLFSFSILLDFLTFLVIFWIFIADWFSFWFYIFYIFYILQIIHFTSYLFYIFESMTIFFPPNWANPRTVMTKTTRIEYKKTTFNDVVVDVDVKVDNLMYYFLIFHWYFLVVTDIWETYGQTNRHIEMRGRI